ncbi:MAG: HigA family addiction module antitoxin [Cyanobacteria bacterium P01_D01_bin.36]
MSKRDFLHIHPGEVLSEDFLKSLNLNQYAIAEGINVPPCRVNEIVHGTRGITADAALRLGRSFNMKAEFWTNLQTRYDLEVLRGALSDKISGE